MKRFFKVSITVLFFFLCAIDANAQIPETEEGKATIVFYRKKKFSGSAIPFNIQNSEKNYGPLKNGEVMTIHVDPGQYTFFSQVISADAITLDVQEGVVYYVKATVKVGYYAGRPKFEQVDEKTALKQMKD